MSQVRFAKVLTFSSEDCDFKASNLLNANTSTQANLSYKGWTCKDAGESNAVVVLQFEKLSKISGLDIGNLGSAFVEVQAGRAGGTSDCSTEDFVCLLPAASFMTPVDCRNESNLSRVRMFNNSQHFVAEHRDHLYNQIKLICTQPFNRRVKYGISFITVYAQSTTLHVDDEKMVTLEEYKSDSSTAKETKDMERSKESTGKDDVKIGNFILSAETDEDDSLSFKPMFQQRKALPKLATRTEGPKEVLGGQRTLASMAIDDLVLSDTTRKGRVLSKENLKPNLLTTTARTPTPGSSKKDSSRTHIVTKTPTSKKGTSEAPQERTISGDPKSDITDSTLSRKRKTRVDPDNVVFVLSGFVNPQRGQLRDKMLSLGATFEKDLTGKVTHLICAFKNTPKFKEVIDKKMDISVVKPEWVNECDKHGEIIDDEPYFLHSAKRSTDSKKRRAITMGDSPSEKPIVKKQEDLVKCDVEKVRENATSHTDVKQISDRNSFRKTPSPKLNVQKTGALKDEKTSSPNDSIISDKESNCDGFCEKCANIFDAETEDECDDDQVIRCNCTFSKFNT